ncbi:MAG TPA: 3-hydroxyacyl-CoA dehydrogenase family protein [Terriglobia bacterium]|nr:3-hydroxyacyl-CoA dehydrogenase family protein [Terriglobia bacterium]
MASSRKRRIARQLLRLARQSAARWRTTDIPAGVVGLGLMGTSITACLLAAGHPVVGVSKDLNERLTRRRLLDLLRGMKREKLLAGHPTSIVKNLVLSEDSSALSDCQVVVESVVEQLAVKHEVFRAIEAVVRPDAIIGSNTSAIPVTILQKGLLNPERFLGIHWGEPAHISRFMEIICGDQTDLRYAERARALAENWNKEPSLVRRDIRGFITNRCFYALLREAFYLVDNGYCTIEDVDRSLRNDYGYWITFAGPFRFMDLTGIPAYRMVMEGLLPELSCSKEVPASMQRVVDSGARGVANAKGFYSYTPQEARRWERRFLQFSYDIRALALKYADERQSKSHKVRRRT